MWVGFDAYVHTITNPDNLSGTPSASYNYDTFGNLKTETNLYSTGCKKL